MTGSGFGPDGNPADVAEGSAYTLDVNFSDPALQNMLLRGIAWAAKKPVDELVDYKAPPAPPRPVRAPAPTP